MPKRSTKVPKNCDQNLDFFQSKKNKKYDKKSSKIQSKNFRCIMHKTYIFVETFTEENNVDFFYIFFVLENLKFRFRLYTIYSNVDLCGIFLCSAAKLNSPNRWELNLFRS